MRRMEVIASTANLNAEITRDNWRQEIRNRFVKGSNLRRTARTYRYTPYPSRTPSPHSNRAGTSRRLNFGEEIPTYYIPSTYSPYRRRPIWEGCYSRGLISRQEADGWAMDGIGPIYTIGASYGDLGNVPITPSMMVKEEEDLVVDDNGLWMPEPLVYEPEPEPEPLPEQVIVEEVENLDGWTPDSVVIEVINIERDGDEVEDDMIEDPDFKADSDSQGEN